MAKKKAAASKVVARNTVDPKADADGDISELVPLDGLDGADEADLTGVAGELPRPAKLGAAEAKAILPGLACPECGYAVTKKREKGKDYHVCTGNYGEFSTCSWHRELDAEGNYVKGSEGDDW